MQRLSSSVTSIVLTNLDSYDILVYQCLNKRFQKLAQKELLLRANKELGAEISALLTPKLLLQVYRNKLREYPNVSFNVTIRFENLPHLTTPLFVSAFYGMVPSAWSQTQYDQIANLPECHKIFLLVQAKRYRRESAKIFELQHTPSHNNYVFLNQVPPDLYNDTRIHVWCSDNSKLVSLQVKKKGQTITNEGAEPVYRFFKEELFSTRM